MLGAEHPDTLTSINNLALVLRDQGKYKKVEEMSRRVLKGREKVLGVEHLSTLTSVSNLALVLQRQRKHEALEMSRRAMEGYGKVLGVEHPTDGGSATLLSLAAQEGHSEFVSLLLSRDCVDFNLKNEHDRTPLLLAASNGHFEVVKLLLQNDSIEPDLRGDHGRTPLSWAAERGHETIARLLLENGADVSIEEPREGKTALHYAVEEGHEAVVQVLLEFGADVKAKYKTGTSLLDLAAARNYQRMVRFLIDNGALLSSISESRYDSDSISMSSSASGSSKASWVASSFTFDQRELPEDVFTHLFQEIFMDPTVKNICRELLLTKSQPIFERIVERAIRGFCSHLRAESPNELQNNSIWILRRNSKYFTFRVFRLLSSSSDGQGDQMEDMIKKIPNVEDKVEKYLVNQHKARVPLGDKADVPSSAEASQHEKASTNIQSLRDHLVEKKKEYPFESMKNEREGEGVGNNSGDFQDTSSESTSEEPADLPNSLTKDTILWLMNGVSFKNFKNNLSRSAYPPLEYVREVLESALPESGACSAQFNVEWHILEYVEKELEDGQKISSILTVSGDVGDAYASTCLEYSRKIWPDNGEVVIRALEEALEATQHSKCTAPLIYL